VPRRRTLVVLSCAAALAVTLSACGAGFDAGTNQVRRVTNGSDGNVGSVAVRNLLLLQDGASPPTTSLTGAFVDNSDQIDQLTGVQVAEAGAITLDPITVPARGIVTPGSGDHPAINVPDATFRPGRNIDVTLTFKNSGQLTMSVLVMLPNGPSNGG
jgi:hypothetical protein